MKNTDLEPPGFFSLPQLIPNTSENRYFYKNGLSKLIPRLKLKVHSEIEDCFYLWDIFSPKQSLFDLWDFRYSWYEGYKYKPLFYTIYENKKPLAVLPLWFNLTKKRYEWFGSNWMEDNTFFVRDDHLIDLLYAVMPAPIHINAIISKNYLKNKLIFSQLKQDEPKNVKNISQMHSLADLFATLHKKSRYHLKADYSKIKAFNPRVNLVYSNDLSYFAKLYKMNTQRFAQNSEDESDLFENKRKNTFINFIRNSGIYKTKFVEVYIQNYLAAIDLIIEYNNFYYAIRGGNDINRFKGIGNFMVYVEFEDAINNNFSILDCLQDDNGWKHRFFDRQPLYLFEK